MAFAHAFQCSSLDTPAIVSTRSEIIRGFIPLVVAIALLHALAALALRTAVVAPAQRKRYSGQSVRRHQPQDGPLLLDKSRWYCVRLANDNR